MNPSTWWALRSAITCCLVRCLRRPRIWLAMGHPDELAFCSRQVSSTIPNILPRGKVRSRMTEPGLLQPCHEPVNVRHAAGIMGVEQADVIGAVARQREFQ